MISPTSWLLVSWLLLLPAALGHLALWVTVFNLLHATRLPCRTVSRLEKFILLAVAGMPALLVAEVLAIGNLPWSTGGDGMLLVLLQAYAGLCWLAAAVWSGMWLYRRFGRPVTERLLANDTHRIDVAAELGRRPIHGFTARLLDRLPGNEILTLDVRRKDLLIPQLAPALDGLRIAHLSDLHFTGSIGPEYFEYVMEQVNQWDADLVAVTGDIVDKTHCQDWIAGTLGTLRARHGKFFVLGNHDLRVADVQRLRAELEACGLEDLGGKWRILTVRGCRILLAGNERPWFRGLPDVPPSGHVPGAEGEDREPCGAEPLRLLLAHTPDQLGWARRHYFDLMLAGHTHGGQVRLPLVGPVVAPSKYGVRYASGVFYRDPTLMHVSRGISGLQPLRWNCPPELALLRLRRA